MAIKEQFNEVFQQIGTLFLNVSVSGEQDYLDLELATSISWRGRFVRKFSIKSETTFSNGDVVLNPQESIRYVMGNLQSDLLLNESIYKTGELYRCNVSGEIAHFVSGERSASNYKVTGTWQNLYSGEYFCIVPNKLELYERDLVPNVVDALYMYASNSLNIQEDHRVIIHNPTIQYYRAKTVDNLSHEGIQIVQLETDKR